MSAQMEAADNRHLYATKPDFALLLGCQFWLVLLIFSGHFLSNPFPSLLGLWVFLILRQFSLPLIFVRL